MTVALVPPEDNAFANDNPPPARNAVLAGAVVTVKMIKRRSRAPSS
jgi:hypothetical protein